MTTPKKKIAFVIGKLSNGGAERVISTLSNELITEYEVLIITFIKREPFYPLNPKIKVVHCMEKKGNSKNFLQSLALNFKLVIKTCKVIKRERVDLMIGFITSANVIATVASKIMGIPSIISERNNPFVEKVPKFWSVQRRFWYPKATHLVLQTQGVRKFYSDSIKENKTSVIANPISKTLTESRSVYDVSSRTILTIGRLAAQKNQQLLIKAFSNLDTDDWTIKMIGIGKKKNELLALIQQLGLGNKIEIIEPKENIADYYNKAGIFAFTSVYEGLPNALIEAMHFGLPCISTDCDFGPSELIENGVNGYLVPMDNQKCFEEKLNALMTNENIRGQFSEKAKISTQKYENDPIVKRWGELIKDVI